MCSKGACKVLLIGFNILFFILGGVVLGIGLFVKFDKKHVTDGIARVGSGSVDDVDVPSLLESAAYVLIAVGGFMFLVGFLGCVGAKKEWRLFLILYAIIVCIVLVAQVGAGLAALFFREKVDDYLLDFLHKTVDEKYTDGVRYVDGNLKVASDALTLSWDIAQFQMTCCGAENYTDYASSKSWNRVYEVPASNGTINITAVVPVSCCVVKDKSKFPDHLDEIEFENLRACLLYPTAESTHMKGCYESVKDEVVKYATLCLAVSLGIALFEIFGVILACYMCRLVGKEGD